MANKKKPEQPVALLTGMSGFIGKHLADYLLQAGVKVAGINNQDLLNPGLLQATFDDIKPTYLFHLASYGNHIHQRDVDETFLANVIKTYTLFRVASQSDVKCIVNFSTQSVYGEYPFPLNENFKPMTETLYGSTKVCAEYLAGMFSKEFKKTFLTIRPFSVYGEGEAEFRFIPTIINSILDDKEFTLYPHPQHDWIYITDLIEAVLQILNMNMTRSDHTIWNVASGVTTDNAGVVKLLEEISGRKAKFDFGKTKKRADNDSIQLEADISALKNLGWSPSFTLRQGLSKTYEYYKSNKKENN